MDFMYLWWHARYQVTSNAFNTICRHQSHCDYWNRKVQNNGLILFSGTPIIACVLKGQGFVDIRQEKMAKSIDRTTKRHALYARSQEHSREAIILRVRNLSVCSSRRFDLPWSARRELAIGSTLMTTRGRSWKMFAFLTKHSLIMSTSDMTIIGFSAL